MQPALSLCPATELDVLGHVERFGRETVSFQVLEPGLTYLAPERDALVAYTDTGACWVAAGAPLCEPARYSDVARAFIRAAAAQRRRAVFCAAESAFARTSGLRSLRIGEQPAWDPCAWPELLRSVRSLREQLRRARARGVIVRALSAAELHERHPIRAALDAIARDWLATRRGPPLSFLLDLQLYSHPERRRVFVAEREGAPVALLAAVPIYGRGGWFVEDVLRGRDAPNGTTELLIDAAMSTCAEAGSHHLTMGLVPLAGEVPWWLRVLRRAGAPFYDFAGLHRYRQKLRPHAWEPVALCFPEGQSPLRSAWDVLCAVTHGRPLRHAALSLTGARGADERGAQESGRSRRGA